LNDIERRNSPYFALFHRIRLLCRPITSQWSERPIVSAKSYPRYIRTKLTYTRQLHGLFATA